MIADGADFGSALADNDVAAVEALPYSVAVLGKHELAVDVGKQFEVAFFMLSLDGAHAFELGRDLVEALFRTYPSTRSSRRPRRL